MKPESSDLSFSHDDFAQALEQYNYQLQRGQVVRGKVAEHDTDGAYIDVGGKTAAFLPWREATLQSEADRVTALPLGEEQEFLVIREQNADGQVTLSVRQLQIQQRWQEMLDLQAGNQVMQVYVTGMNKGGVTVDVRGLRGFIPRSHLIIRDNLESLQGQTLTVSFLEVDRDRNRLVLSERVAAQTARFSQFEVGQLVEGVVSNIKPFGVFVDLGGATGLLHINQVSQRFVPSLSELFTTGQSLKALIVDLDEGKNRITLSTKVLENYPGEVLENLGELIASADARAERARKQLTASEG